jgi:hypothetical protein
MTNINSKCVVSSVSIKGSPIFTIKTYYTAFRQLSVSVLR